MPDLATHQREFARALRAIDRGGDGRKRDDCGRTDDASRWLFTTDLPGNRTGEVVCPSPDPVPRIPRGRDTKLEQVSLNRIRDSLFL